MNTTKVIEFLISTVIILRGVYYAYAFINPQLGDGLLEGVAGYPYIMLLIGMVMVIPGLVTVIGNMKDNMKLKNIGLFVMSLCFMFISSLHVVAETPRPFSWLYPFALALIAGAVWLHNRLEIRNER